MGGCERTQCTPPSYGPEHVVTLTWSNKREIIELNCSKIVFGDESYPDSYHVQWFIVFENYHHMSFFLGTNDFSQRWLSEESAYFRCSKFEFWVLVYTRKTDWFFMGWSPNFRRNRYFFIKRILFRHHWYLSTHPHNAENLYNQCSKVWPSLWLDLHWNLRFVRLGVRNLEWYSIL